MAKYAVQGYSELTGWESLLSEPTTSKKQAEEWAKQLKKDKNYKNIKVVKVRVH
jgi:hypothetical protein